MSSIFGIFQRMDTPMGDLSKTLLWNRAYGRLQKELYTGNGICLGCCSDRLSVYSEQNSLIIKKPASVAAIDAVLYNHPELAANHNLSASLSDEQLLYQAISLQGMDALSDVNGDFSGALYSDTDHSLILFRDHMGVRPLYYYADEHLLAFSTDIRGLLAIDGVETTLNEDWIYRTCAGYYLDGVTATEFAHIFCIAPGSYTKFSFLQDRISAATHSYWKLGKRKIRLSSFDEYKNALRELVADSVRRRLSVIPGTVGAELSGGLDSGVIDILIHRAGRDCIYYSWSVDPQEVPYAKDDERLVIADICKQEGISCNFGHLRDNRWSGSNLHQSMLSINKTLDEAAPPAFRYALPPYINALTLCDTSEFIERHGARVVFTGHGGDEGVSHRCNVYELLYHHEYYHFLRHLWSTTHGKKYRIVKTLKACYKTAFNDRQYFKKPLHMPFAAPEFLNQKFADSFQESEMPSLHFAYAPIEYIKEGGSRNRLDNVAILGAYNGVRYLIPYLDYRVIDFAVSIPRHLYLHGAQNRYLFREAFRDIMPSSLYTLKLKEDTSRKNYPKDPDWYVEYQKVKDYVYHSLDQKQWAPYLDFSAIDAWMQQGKPTDEERSQDISKLTCLFYCALASNLVNNAKNL